MKFVKFSIRFLIVVFLLSVAFVIFLPEREKDVVESDEKLEWYSYVPYDEESHCKIKMGVYIENNTAFGHIEFIPNFEITTRLLIKAISYNGSFIWEKDVSINASVFGTNKVYRTYFDPTLVIGACIQELGGREYYIFMNTDAFNYVNNITKDNYQVWN